MSIPIYLGRPIFEPRPFTRIEPVAQQDGGCWRIYQSWNEALPTEGRVFAPRLSGFGEGDLLAFGIELNSRPEAGPDRYIISNPLPVLEVLDLRRMNSEMARRYLEERGVESLLPNTQSIVAALENDRCVVLRMVRHPTAKRWVTDMDGLETLQTNVLDPRIFDGDRIAGRWVTVPGQTIGPPSNTINWSSDHAFLETVVRRLRKVAPPDHLSRVQLTQLLGYLTRAEVLPSAGTDLAPLVERLQTFNRDLARNVEMVDRLVEAVSKLRPVDEALVARRSEIEAELRRALELQIRQELALETASLTAERDRLASEVCKLSETATRERENAQQAIIEAENARLTLKTELSDVLTQLADVSIEAEDTVKALSARLSARLRDPAQDFGSLAGPMVPWGRPGFAEPEFIDWKDFDKSREHSALRYGIEGQDLMLADVSARAGELVVLPEECASRFVDCYANAISAGEWIRHVLDPSLLSTDDIWRQPVGNRSTALGRAWAAAKFDPRRYQVVLLDGLQRTPLDLWLPSFVDLLRDHRRPSNLLVFASIATPFLDASRAWRSLDRSVAISPNFAAGVTTELLARATRRTLPNSCFDASTTPQPDRQHLAEFISDFEQTTGLFGLQRLASIYCAILGLEFDAEKKRLAGAFVGAAGADTDILERLQKGTKWLRAVIDSSTNSLE